MPSKSIADQLVKDFSNLFFHYFPSIATSIGIHDYDQLLAPSSHKVWEDFPTELKAWKTRLAQVEHSILTPAEQEDFGLLVKTAELACFKYETRQFWRKNPGFALEYATWQVEMQLQRTFAPFIDRIHNIIALLSQLPGFLLAIRDWPQNPVALWTKKAITSAEGIPKLYEHIMKTSKQQLPREVLDELQQAVQLASHAVEDHKSWLEGTVLPKAKGSWVLGPEHYRELLALQQSPLTIPEMEALAQHFLSETREQLAEVAEIILPGGSIEDAVEEIKEDHPADFEETLEAYKAAMRATRQFILDKRLATIPPDEKLLLVETPPHLRPFIPAAAYEFPAKYDPVQEGIFFVTPPEADGKLLRSHNYGNIQLIGLHEGYPGHHLQGVCSLRAASLAKAVSSRPVETVEGWALYCEWMMEEHGFSLSPAGKFAQLQGTLMRAVRVLVDIGMGMGRMSVKDTAAYLVQEANIEKGRAQMEAELYTTLPAYFAGYLVGAHLIIELKKRACAHQGRDFDERAFHDLLLSSMFLTIPSIEQKMQALGWLPGSDI